jgi:metal-responsive CopG/Arc/MetJ family transcriptional regulator
MKTAISLDDDLLRAADEAAQSLGLSRSRLFAIAVGDFLERHRKDEMLQRLNEVYADGIDASEKRLLRRVKAKVRRTIGDRW